MRPKERIPIFLEKVDFDFLEERWDVDIPQLLRGIILDPNFKIHKYWVKNYDQRFGQVLINLGYVKDILKIWTDEESSILDDQGVPRREFMLWGSIYDENRNPLPEIRYRLIKDMDTNHILAILKDIEDMKYNLPAYYINVFEEEIKLRNK